MTTLASLRDELQQLFNQYRDDGVEMYLLNIIWNDIDKELKAFERTLRDLLEERLTEYHRGEIVKAGELHILDLRRLLGEEQAVVGASE